MGTTFCQVHNYSSHFGEGIVKYHSYWIALKFILTEWWLEHGFSSSHSGLVLRRAVLRVGPSWIDQRCSTASSLCCWDSYYKSGLLWSGCILCAHMLLPTHLPPTMKQHKPLARCSCSLLDFPASGTISQNKHPFFIKWPNLWSSGIAVKGERRHSPL